MVHPESGKAVKSRPQRVRENFQGKDDGLLESDGESELGELEGDDVVEEDGDESKSKENVESKI